MMEGMRVAKRKRGRPRKDSNVSAETKKLTEDGNGSNIKDCSCSCSSINDGNGNGMVGSMVYGVVEGSFDAGYLISVRIGTSLTPLRGLVFQPRKVVAVTPANDLAPQAKMYQRRQLPSPINLNQGLPYNLHSSSMYTKDFPSLHLRMVEEDQVMQAFEVSNKEEGIPAFEIKTSDHDHVQEYYNMNQVVDNSASKSGQNMEQYTLNKEKQIAAATDDSWMKNPNVGYHQALVSGNPLLLPPDIMGEFMMERPKTPITNSQETNVEVQSRLVHGGGGAVCASSSPHTRIADMDFLLCTQSNAATFPSNSQTNQS